MVPRDSSFLASPMHTRVQLDQNVPHDEDKTIFMIDGTK